MGGKRDEWVWHDDTEIDESPPSKFTVLKNRLLSGPQYWWPTSTPVSIFNTDWDDTEDDWEP